HTRPPYIPLFLFFFPCSAHHPHLHSFPTRRSSDLPHDYEPRPSDVEGAASAEAIFASGDGLDDWIGEIVSDSGSDAEVVDVAARSEEHTSELQSRGHLVCRLLLEKKKKKQKHVE